MSTIASNRDSYVEPIEPGDRIMLCNANGDLEFAHVVDSFQDHFDVIDSSSRLHKRLQRFRFYYAPTTEEIASKTARIRDSYMDAKLRRQLRLPMPYSVQGDRSAQEA